MDSLKNLVREKHMYMARIGVAVLVCLAMTALLLFRLAKLQVVDREYYATRAEENRMRLSAVPPVRGLVTDRNGILLAQNTPAFVLEIVPEQVQDMDALIARLRPLIGLQDAEIARFKSRVDRATRDKQRYLSLPLRSNMTGEQVARFQLNRFDYEGADVTATLTRSYPLGAAAAHVIGYVGGITEEEFKKIDAAAYQGLTQIGKIGVEKSHENELRGLPGAKIVEANVNGRPLRELEYRQGAPGKNLILTLDAKVQLAAQNALMVRWWRSTRETAMSSHSCPSPGSIRSPSWPASTARPTRPCSMIASDRCTTVRCRAPIRPARPSNRSWRSPAWNTTRCRVATANTAADR
jgi:penicillin-binding protein 2